MHSSIPQFHPITNQMLPIWTLGLDSVKLGGFERVGGTKEPAAQREGPASASSPHSPWFRLCYTPRPCPDARYEHYDLRRYQSMHMQGGTIMAASPGCGVVSPYLQQWHRRRSCGPVLEESGHTCMIWRGWRILRGRARS